MAKSTKRDALGDRMKRYENVTRFTLPKRTYTIMRIDGRAFHTWTKGLKRPYDISLMDCMNAAALALCEQIANTRFAYIQSDEISILATDFETTLTEPWFDGTIQKFASVGASIATQAFNSAVSDLNLAYDEFINRGRDGVAAFLERGWVGQKKAPDATFDARVFVIPDLIEVENYFVWRQQDAERNSVTMLAQAYASAKELHGKNRAAQHEIIYKAGDNWAKHPASFKHGRIVRRQAIDYLGIPPAIPAGRQSNWFVDEDTPVFTKSRFFLRTLIPLIWDNDLLVRKDDKQ
jgi:tRNA(His) 5'-end guanylyltransferase